MRYDERDDGELVELAQAGWAPAFAVLVHRHAPSLLAAFADDPDPSERVTELFLRAMRQLPERDPAAPVGPWLFDLAGRPVPSTVPPVGDETLDPIWRELGRRWPDGRSVRRHRPVARKVLTVIGALGLGVAVPIIVLGMPASPDDESTESVRAQPTQEEPVSDDEPVELPTFEFPDVSNGGVEEPTSGPADPPPTTDQPLRSPTDGTGGDAPTTPGTDGTTGGAPAGDGDAGEGAPDGTADGGNAGGGSADGTTDGAITDGGTDGTGGGTGGGTTDGTGDGGATDGGGGGSTDGGATDGGATDGGTTDGGTTDGGTTDGGTTDGGTTDGSADGGNGGLLPGLGGGRP